jgi:hypothetical protein
MSALLPQFTHVVCNALPAPHRDSQVLDQVGALRELLLLERAVEVPQLPLGESLAKLVVVADSGPCETEEEPVDLEAVDRRRIAAS